MIEEETPKYKKKSKGKPHPRANHRHKYIRALVCYEMSMPFDTDKPHHRFAAIEEVCTICGRRGSLKWSCVQSLGTELKEGKISLPYYYADDYLSKNARPMSEEEIEGWKQDIITLWF